MSYVKDSTENPYGFRPWGFATSNNGLSKYIGANFALPTYGNGLGRMRKYIASPFAIPTSAPDLRVAYAWPGLSKYIGSPFVIPTTGAQNPDLASPYAWPSEGMGDYEVDPSTLPPPPAGMMYNAQYALVPVPPPQPDYAPWLLGAAGIAAAWWYFSKNKRGGLKLPMVGG